MLLNRPFQLLAVAVGAGSMVLAAFSSSATAQRPTYRNISQGTSHTISHHNCPCPCPTDDGAAAGPAEGEDLPEVADVMSDGGYASAPQSAVPNAIGDSMYGCFSGFSSSGGGLTDLTAPICPGGHRFRISENNSALPQHRVYYNYHYFNNAMRVTEGVDTSNIDVQRHVFGVEYPFWCNMASVGVEVPFENTINSGLVRPDAGLRDTEFGNISVYLKTVLYQDCCKTFSAGLGIDLPTADDVTLVAENAGAPNILNLDNDVVILSPYAAVLVADPCSNMFMHGFVQVDLPTERYDVELDGTDETIDAQNLLHIDGSIGYWLQRDCCGNGVAAIAELHYTTALESGNTVVVGGNSITRNSNDLFNATLGAAVVRGCWSVTPAVVLPLMDRPDRAFDWEAVVQINRRF